MCATRAWCCDNSCSQGSILPFKFCAIPAHLPVSIAYHHKRYYTQEVPKLKKSEMALPKPLLVVRINIECVWQHKPVSNTDSGTRVFDQKSTAHKFSHSWSVRAMRSMVSMPPSIANAESSMYSMYVDLWADALLTLSWWVTFILHFAFIMITTFLHCITVL